MRPNIIPSSGDKKTVGFKVSPITCKTKITDGVKNVNSLFNIINKQTSFFEYVNLLFCGYSLMRVSNSHKKMSRWVR